MENENESRANNFNILRFIGASFVIISHSFSLLNFHQIDFLGSLGVTIFLTISGYLITQSWIHSPHAGKFMKKRLLRIIPALAFCVLVTIFIIGSLTTTLPLTEYFTNHRTWTYLSNILLYPLQFTLPGVFTNNISRNLVNHSLWTLPVEFTAYIFIVLLGVFHILKKNFIIVLSIALFFIFLYLGENPIRGISIYDFGINDIIAYFIFFFVGSLIYLGTLKVRFNIFLFAGALILYIATFFFKSLLSTDFITIPYMIFAVAFYHKKVNLFGTSEPSYGMYLFSMPIQQTFISFFPGISPFTLVFLSFAATMPVAFISWHLIESKAMLLKKHM